MLFNLMIINFSYSQISLIEVNHEPLTRDDSFQITLINMWLLVQKMRDILIKISLQKIVSYRVTIVYCFWSPEGETFVFEFVRPLVGPLVGNKKLRKCLTRLRL